MFVLIEFKYKPNETRTPPIKNKINGGQILLGRIADISLGKFISKEKLPTRKTGCSRFECLSK